MQVAFLGLGIMGHRMAANLAAHFDLKVWNRSAGPAEELAEKGAIVAQNPTQAVHGADVVFTMLSTPEVVRTLAIGSEGFLHEMKGGALWVDCSTVDPENARLFNRKAIEFGLRFLEAPVAGTSHHAENAQLKFMVGGDTVDLETARPLFEVMGQGVNHIGEVGKASAFKLLVNGMLAQSMVVFAETVQLGREMGLDRDWLLDTLPQLPVSAPFLAAKAEKMKANDYSVEFPLEWMLKDLHLLGQVAAEKHMPQYLASVSREVYTAADRRGLSREDFSAVFDHLEYLRFGK